MLHIFGFMGVYFRILAFFVGAIFAKFLEYLGWHMSNGESVLKRRNTIHQLSSIRELLLAILFMLATFRWGITPKLILMLLFFCVLYLLSLVDIYIQEIPDSCHLVAIGIRFLYYFLYENFQLDTFIYLIASGIFVVLPLLFVTFIIEKILRKEAFGGGDIKLIFVTGLYLGWECNMLMLLVACIIGIIIGLVQGYNSSKELDYFPFGPVIAVATVFCLFFGDNIMNKYIL